MKIDGISILPRIVEQANRSNKTDPAKFGVSRKDQITVRTPEDRHHLAPDSVIEAEYVEIFIPLRRPPEEQRWRNLIIEQGTHTAKPDPEIALREQFLTKGYGRNTGDAPPPGSFVNLFA